MIAIVQKDNLPDELDNFSVLTNTKKLKYCILDDCFMIIIFIRAVLQFTICNTEIHNVGE